MSSNPLSAPMAALFLNLYPHLLWHPACPAQSSIILVLGILDALACSCDYGCSIYLSAIHVLFLRGGKGKNGRKGKKERAEPLRAAPMESFSIREDTVLEKMLLCNHLHLHWTHHKSFLICVHLSQQSISLSVLAYLFCMCVLCFPKGKAIAYFT